MTLSEMHHLRRLAEGRLAVRSIDASFGGMKRKKAHKIKKPTVSSFYRAADTSDLQIKGTIFDSLEFCVTHGSDAVPKNNVEIMIAGNGGKFVQNPSLETRCVISGKIGLKETNLMKQGSIDLVKLDWLLDCVNEKRLIPLQPK